MSRFAEPMSRLIDELKKLPGIAAERAAPRIFHPQIERRGCGSLAAAVRDVRPTAAVLSV